MRILSLSLAAALACLAAFVAEAASFDTPDRYVNALLYQCTSSGCTNIGGGFERHSTAGPWDVDGTDPAFPDNTAFQHSLIEGGHAEGTGGITLALPSPASESTGFSTMASGFTLTAPAILSISATVEFTQNAAALALGVSLSGGVRVDQYTPTGEVQDLIFLNLLTTGGGLDHGSRTIHFEQRLAPGVYGFAISVFGSQTAASAGALSTFNWSGSADLIAVPEPAGLAPAALALAFIPLVAGAGRRSRPR